MMSVGLNHMTVARQSARGLIDIAQACGCVGVELRNDLGQPLFDGETPESFRDAVRGAGLRILALAEVKSFNIHPRERLADATRLFAQAAACGAEGVALIPHMGTAIMPRDAQRAHLAEAIRTYAPALADHGLRGFVEPLGFANSTLRHKEDAVAILDAEDAADRYGLVHDTFHHCLAGGGAVYPALTAIVHISGVADADVPVPSMTDAHRGLVDAADRLGNIEQLRTLRDGGYDGPLSFEAFAPEIHTISEPAKALTGSIAFIAAQLEPKTAVVT